MSDLLWSQRADFWKLKRLAIRSRCSTFQTFTSLTGGVVFFYFGSGKVKTCAVFKNPFQGLSNSNILHFVGSESFKSAGNDPQSGLVAGVVVVSRWMQTSDITQRVNTSEGQQRAARTVFCMLANWAESMWTSLTQNVNDPFFFKCKRCVVRSLSFSWMVELHRAHSRGTLARFATACSTIRWQTAIAKNSTFGIVASVIVVQRSLHANQSGSLDALLTKLIS